MRIRIKKTIIKMRDKKRTSSLKWEQLNIEMRMIKHLFLDLIVVLGREKKPNSSEIKKKMRRSSNLNQLG